MIATPQHAAQIAPIGHAEAMAITETENARLLSLLTGLTDEQWAAPTDCTGWSVRDIAVHLIGSAHGQANPVEFARQALVCRRLTKEIGGHHWVDGLNEAQLRARAGMTPEQVPDEWQRHSAAALKARRRMPAPVRALKLLPIGTGLGVHIGWQPLGYLFDIGFTRDVWMHRVDIAHAAGVEPEVTAEHDGRLIADILREWASRHGQPFDLTLTGPAGGRYVAGQGGEPQSVDAVEFVRILAGRAEGPGVLQHKLPL